MIPPYSRSRGGDKTLSADTYMGEMIITATKRSESRIDLSTADVITVTLDEPFSSIAVAAETGRSIDAALRDREEQREGPDASRWLALGLRRQSSDHTDVRFGFTIWANSTLGMVVHWSRAQRQQHGRSSAQLEGIRQMPCPDFNDSRIYAAAAELLRTHRELMRVQLMSARDAYRDPARAELDFAAAEMVGIPDPEALRDLARDWCSEPSVHDGDPPTVEQS
ncbi:hypothetical protein [Candidatus Poriferisodalis sp.]|uniref:hypothetical protein n=1 Tax=Candidatus Poriferisodalis sp. TaxID=3101277 RepID=UPI003AF8B7B2